VNMRFSDKVAVVTGADSGIGRATAIRMLDEGARIVAVDRKHDQPWPEQHRERVRVVQLDVSDPDSPGKLEALLREEYGRVDIVANVAGVLEVAPFVDVSRESWDRVIAINLTGVFFIAQACARIMVEKKIPGRIINISSVHAVVSEPNAAPYTATKAGIEGMTRTIASELAPFGITANCVRPGAIDTPMAASVTQTPGVLAALLDRIPLRKMAPPEWVANMICYLASDESAYTTGASIDVDGGYSMDGSLSGFAYE
jgi:NAD(P)-dependent dehydrogenase (short-subunit alcohol dehydrogenase family)